MRCNVRRGCSGLARTIDTRGVVGVDRAREGCAMIGGGVAAGFEPVCAEFEANFARRGELGAACAAYHRGGLIVDLWGGHREARGSLPWEQDTLVLMYSTSKGLAAIAVARFSGRSA